MRISEPQLEKPQAGLVAVDGTAFPLESATIHASARGGIAWTTLRQAFRNPHDEPLEVTYTLPLPADGAVVGFEIQVGDKRITGEIEPHDKALKKYREALETGRVAGILEQDRADTFTQNLGNVPPRAAVEVEIRVLHAIAFHASSGENPAEWEYRFPTVVGVRYEGGSGRVPDRERLDVDRADSGGTPVRLGMELAIGDGDAAEVNPRSASHSIQSTDGAETGTTLVRFEEPSRLDRDVIVAWRAATDAVGLRLIEGTGLAGDGGRYGLLTIVPPGRAGHTIARDLTLLIDASGSMSGLSLEIARELSARLLNSLGLRDRFQILAFASEIERLIEKPTEAMPRGVERGLRALAGLQAGGATEMSNAVDEALKPLRGESQRQVVLLTDGFIGFEQEVVRRILDHLPAGARLHVVGIGSAPNRTLTRGASRAGRGAEVLVAGAGAIESAAARLLAATVGPVLADITIEGPGVVAVAPARPRDVLAGQPAVVALELNPAGGEISVRGTVQGTAEPWTRTILVPASTSRTDLPIGALFGREAIEDEEMNLAAAGAESRAILERIEALGLRHRIASRCTTLVAVADEPSVDPRQPRRRHRLAVEMPAGLNPEAVGYAAMGQVQFLGASAPLVLGAPSVGDTRVLHADSVFEMEDRVISRLRERHIDKAIRHERVSPGARAPESRIPPETPVPREILARCVRTEGDLLVIEFETPGDDFELPADGRAMVALTEDGETLELTVDADLSTFPGPCRQGLTLRLALRRADGSPWTPGRVRLMPRPDEVHSRSWWTGGSGIIVGVA